MNNLPIVYYFYIVLVPVFLHGSHRLVCDIFILWSSLVLLLRIRLNIAIMPLFEQLDPPTPSKSGSGPSRKVRIALCICQFIRYTFPKMLNNMGNM